MIDQRTFVFPFEDEDWGSKFLIGSLLYLFAPFLFGIPLIIPQGYALRVWRDAVAGLAPSLPTWDDWEGMSLQGLVYFVVTFLYSLPLWLLGAFAVIVAAGGALALPWVASELEAGGALAALLLVTALFVAVGAGLVALVALVISLLIGLLSPVAVSRYVETKRFGAAFEFGALWRATRANLGELVLAWVLILVVSLLLGSIVGTVGAVPCFGALFAYLFMAPVMFYLSLVQARLMGQVYHGAQRRLSTAAETRSAEPIAVVPEPVEETVEAPVVEPLKDTPYDEQAPIETLELSTRVRRVLRSAGITTVGQVLERLAKGEATFLSIRGLGIKALEEIRTKLAAHGFLDFS